MARGGSTEQLLPTRALVEASRYRVRLHRRRAVHCLEVIEGDGPAREAHLYRSPFSDDLLLFDQRISGGTCGARIAPDLGMCLTCLQHSCRHLDLVQAAMTGAPDLLRPIEWVRSMHPLGVSYRTDDAEIVHLNLAARRPALLELVRCDRRADAAYPLRRGSDCYAQHAHFRPPDLTIAPLWDLLASYDVIGMELSDLQDITAQFATLATFDGSSLVVRAYYEPKRDQRVHVHVAYEGHTAGEVAVRASCCGSDRSCAHWALLDRLAPRVARAARGAMEIQARAARLVPAAA